MALIGMDRLTNCARDSDGGTFDAAIRFDDSMERAVFPINSPDKQSKSTECQNELVYSRIFEIVLTERE
jgi:hypothetical protein